MSTDLPFSSSSTTEQPPPKLRFADIGINLTDPVYNGIYHSKSQHPDDLADVVARARAAGCMKMMVTASDLDCARKALDVVRKFR
ncbi:hypothetical protein GP486_002215 [Trichoglossum hirsutum]|uniref:Uncharacterized protein n=1 Tax=Trichoglossum hirsutum TaxID=265104 RepID=A0A9P8RSA5_9PEZI|nr:hypothetical protein GP486_002215 [Trichoglossum hirsutum]